MMQNALNQRPYQARGPLACQEGAPAPLLKVVVAEDCDIQRLYVCGLIEAMGFEALPAENGHVALELARVSNAQIIVTDLKMPGLNGIELTKETRRLALEHYVHVIMVTSSDEVEARNEAFDAGVDDFFIKGGSPAMFKARINTATRLINHANELADRARILKESNDIIQEDLRAAAAAQRQLLPECHDDIMGFRIASIFVPSAIVSGDMFGCFPLSDQKLGFYTVDVSGHGVHASLLSVAIGHLITPEYFLTKTVGADGQPDPAALVADLNARFSAVDNDAYFTMFCGVIDTATGRVDYCQAGAPNPYRVSENGCATSIGDGGFPVGMLSVATYENNTLNLGQGDSLILCSDAASEAESLTHQQFGTDRVHDIAKTTTAIGAQNVPDRIVRALADWRGGQPLEDDLTVVTIERRISHDTHNHI